MAIFKRTNSKYYWTKFRFRGTEINESTKCTSAVKAREYEAALRSQLSLGRIGIETLRPDAGRSSVSVRAIVQEYVDWSELNCAQSTVTRYRTASKALAAHFGETPAAAVETADVERFIIWRRSQKRKAPARKLRKDPRARSKKPIGNASINRELTLLSAAYKRQVDAGGLPRNPVSPIKPLKEQFRHSESVVTKSDFQAYVMAASQPLRDTAVIMYETGMRPSEVLALEKAHIDLEIPEIRIVRGKTDSARRRIRISGSLAALLETRIKAAPGKYLFAGGKRSDGPLPIVKVNGAHNAAVKRAGVRPFRLYDLRHTFATQFVQSGGDLVTLAAVLGHSKLSMVTRYAHPTEQHQADAMERLQRFRAGLSNVVPFRRTGSD